MAASSASLHEPPEIVGTEVVDRHRAIVSIMEELEAIDWYDQRVAGATDPELAGILAHNRDEEKEHAAMTLEWLRRRDTALDQELRTYLFTSEPVLEVEAAGMSGSGSDSSEGEVAVGGGSGDGSLGIGGLRGAQR